MKKQALNLKYRFPEKIKMEEIKKIDSKIKEWLSEIKNKKTLWIVLLGICGIALICLSELFPKDTAEIHKTEENFRLDFSERETELENRLEEAVSKINGAGETDITVTYESTKEFFYAKNSSETNGDTETESEFEFVIIDGANGEEPIFIKADEAKIRGVLVVCEGGGNALVREKIIEAICALLDIPSNKVSVAEMA